jgi:hypothetical protein
MSIDWSPVVMLVFPLVYTIIIYRYVTRKYGVIPEGE